MGTLNSTLHIDRRMNQRGITKSMIAFALEFGELKGEKYKADRKVTRAVINEIDQQIKSLQQMRKVALKVLDKGGVTIVTDNGCLITTYNTNSYCQY